MTHYDVFNGDADGIFSLIQLRLDQAKESILVTGVKRDISLLDGLDKKIAGINSSTNNISLCVLDISLDKNRKPLLNILEHGAKVLYIDHHFSGDIPQHKNLSAHINEAPNICTSLLVNGLLKSKHSLWAIAGAFGDNLKDSALSLAKTTNLNPKQLEQLQHLGTYVNYNGYGASLQDLHFTPEALYKSLAQHSNPLAFIDQATEYQQLESGYHEDMQKVAALTPNYQTETVAAFILPNEKWARRVSGVFGNSLANQYPNRAHAVLTEDGNNGYVVSVRAPLSNKQGAAELCRQFVGGGGRAAAAGINKLPQQQLESFLTAFNSVYS